MHNSGKEEVLMDENLLESKAFLFLITALINVFPQPRLDSMCSLSALLKACANAQ